MASGSGIGALRERITIEENVPDPIAVTSITRATTTATVTTSAAHGYASSDYVRIAGASPAAYNGAQVKITVTAPTTFTYQVAGSPTSPATGTITATYVSDPQGNRKVGWSEHADVAAEVMPLNATERLAYGAIPALATETQYRFRIQVRADLTDQMRVRWTPRWPPEAPEHVLEIIGILPEGDGRRFVLVDCTE